jgi:hypothetical protein
LSTWPRSIAQGAPGLEREVERVQGLERGQPGGVDGGGEPALAAQRHLRREHAF